MRVPLAVVTVLALVAGAEARTKQTTNGSFTLQMTDKPDVGVRRSMMDHGGAAPARTGLPLVDADATVSALFGGADVSCAVAANAGFCGFPIIASVCPLSCSDYVGVPENFGEADDEAMLVDLFANLYEPGVMQGSFGVESCSSLADPEVEAYVTINTNGNVYIGCDEPGIAIACPVTCGTNFMTFPPEKNVRVMLPGCGSRVKVTEAQHARMAGDTQLSTGAGVCTQ